MIVGEVTQDKEAVLGLLLRGQTGQQIEVKAIVDTGFTLTSPTANARGVLGSTSSLAPVLLREKE